ncbi:MarR family transcriptional regulator [Kineosporia sp. J2-2]|uniref:MarR family transcriptional regulator n=1 Tax=Kineosporia corallincola TaxID=2835133 RepID=A0ABS5TC50_9ACTN|nr:MarR family transcriptional regulator [Kineosporia corallincola]MBT0768663.1 MarR family transcriptional regulator [Kineosporia corallincola]
MAVTKDHAPGERVALLADIAELVRLSETAALPLALRNLLETDLTFQQLKVLTVLVSSPGGSPLGELAQTFGVSLASMSTMVDRLVSQHTARRDVDASDHRVRRVHATAPGRDVVRKLVNARPEFADDILARLSLDDLRALTQGLRAVTVAVAELRHTTGRD